MMMIGSLTFLAVVIVTLSIVLPITLQNRDDQTNKTTESATTSSSDLFNTSMYIFLSVCRKNELFGYLFNFSVT